MHYEADDYVHERFDSDSINVNCVLSWRLVGHSENAADLFIDFHNGWVFDSGVRCSLDLRQRLLKKLRAVEGVRGLIRSGWCQ